MPAAMPDGAQGFDINTGAPPPMANMLMMQKNAEDCAQAKDLIRRVGDVIILSPDHIMDFFNVQSELETGFPLDAGEWLAAGS